MIKPNQRENPWRHSTRSRSQEEEYTIAGSHNWPMGNLEDGCLKKANSSKMKEAIQSGRDKIKEI